jgi:hypothetical protein
LRSAFLYFPNGVIPSAWWPAETGPLQALSGSLAPLQELKDYLQVLGGLDQLNALAGDDGGGDHARGSGVFLTGVRINKSATDIRAGVSIDQAIASQVGPLTRLASLELSADPEIATGSCDSGYACAYQFNISWKNPTTPMTAERNPRLVFERLFGSGSPKERAANLKRRRTEQHSILDFVHADARRLQRKLNTGDRAKIEQYLDGVRDVEQRLERLEKFGAVSDPGGEAPQGIPPNAREHVETMCEMLLLAFQADLTRVATLILAHDGSNRSFAEIGVVEGHHELSHHQNDAEKVAKLAQIDHWYAERLAYLLRRLRDTPDVDGKSLLDNSMVLYGGGIADGNSHAHANLPLVLAGHGGGTLTPGRYLQCGSQPLCNLYLALADRMGATALPRFGDSTQRLGNV